MKSRKAVCWRAGWKKDCEVRILAERGIRARQREMLRAGHQVGRRETHSYLVCKQ
jgi:hypothetical protein